MPASNSSFSLQRWSPALVMLCMLLGVLWLAGGASRADVPGQILVRGVSWGVLCVSLLTGEPAMLRQGRPVLILLLAALLLALAQLVPLPPTVWQALPGRNLLINAATLSGQPQPWRPWSIVPAATLNAVSSFVVPLAMLACVIGLRPSERQWLPSIVLAIMALSIIVGLLQFSGAGFSNPFVNNTPGEVSGTFANRNHYALFLALGCLVAPTWAFLDGRRPGWRAPVALGLLLLFVLVILATGSRSGILTGMLGLGLGFVIVRQGIRRALQPYPRWVFPVFVTVLLTALAGMVLLSIAADRAVSIDRMLVSDPGQDMRTRGLPTVLAMVAEYFPLGSGLGGFDPVFRMHEPFGLLKPTFFNHAHNDWLEVVLDAGLAGLLLLVSAVSWWGWTSIQAWRAGASVRYAVPKLGSAMLLLIMVASVFDYPARTPMMMAMIVIAGGWLGSGRVERDRSALPTSDQHL